MKAPSAATAARLANALIREAGTSWHDLLPDVPDKRRAQDSGDLEKLDQLLASERVTDVLKLRLRDMRAALQRGRLGEADRRLLRILHRKAVIDGAIVEM